MMSCTRHTNYGLRVPCVWSEIAKRRTWPESRVAGATPHTGGWKGDVSLLTYCSMSASGLSWTMSCSRLITAALLSVLTTESNLHTPVHTHVSGQVTHTGGDIDCGTQIGAGGGDIEPHSSFVALCGCPLLLWCCIRPVQLTTPERRPRHIQTLFPSDRCLQ